MNMGFLLSCKGFPLRRSCRRRWLMRWISTATKRRYLDKLQATHLWQRDVLFCSDENQKRLRSRSAACGGWSEAEEAGETSKNNTTACTMNDSTTNSIGKGQSYWRQPYPFPHSCWCPGGLPAGTPSNPMLGGMGSSCPFTHRISGVGLPLFCQAYI